ncbi:MAG TPA: M56 family metallopeptidase [Terracidiphilus sp.]|jgi:beta-lactamase regulating signal transducer with metallopeptidase domain
MNHSVLSDILSWFLLHGKYALPAGLRTFAQIAAPDALAALWQGALVAAGLAVCLRLAPRMAAAHRFAIWGIGYGVLASLQFLPFVTHFTSGAAMGNPAASILTSHHAWLELDARWSLGLAALWIALGALRAGDLFIHSIRLRRLWRSATLVEDGRSAALLADPTRRRAQVCTTRALDRPSVIGFFAPRILIPEWLYARLTPEELEQIVLHEAEHLCRRDDWTNLLQKLCLVLFPLNPALLWMERRLCREREMACDDGVVRVTQAPRAYAACLAGLAERRLERRAEMLSMGALSLGAFERRPELVHRVHSILLRKTVLNPMSARALLGVVGCGLLFVSVELASCPQVVAFVPAHRATNTWAAPIASTQAYTAAYLPARAARIAPDENAGNMGAFHAENVEAILPGRVRRTSLSGGLPQHMAVGNGTFRSARAESSELAAVETRQPFVKTARHQRATAAAQPQEWIMLTTWQVQSSAQAAPEITDTAGTDRGTQPAADQAGRQPSPAASRITITRLILRVYPAAPTAGSPAAKQAPASRPGSTSRFVVNRPALLPFDSGWLVIQL